MLEYRAGLQFVFEVSAFGAAAIMMGWMGTQTLAAHQIAINLAAISYMMATGIASAATIRVGNQLGRKDMINLRTAGNSCFVMVTLFMGFAALVFVGLRNFFPNPIYKRPRSYRDSQSIIGGCSVFPNFGWSAGCWNGSITGV